jgi:hypothetical protein
MLKLVENKPLNLNRDEYSKLYNVVESAKDDKITEFVIPDLHECKRQLLIQQEKELHDQRQQLLKSLRTNIDNMRG